MRDTAKVDAGPTGDQTMVPENVPRFTTPSIEKLLEQVAHAAQFTGGIQVVEGPRGSGKSTLAAELCKQHLAQAALLGFVHVPADLDVHGVLLASAQALGLPAKEAHLPGELMASLRSLAQSLQVQSQVAVLVIDDAHRLDQQALGALVSLLQGGGESVFGLHLVLWSEPGLVERLDALHVVEVPVHDFAVPLLTVSEAGNFLRQSLQRAQKEGEKAGRAYTGADLQEIWRDSGGCIGLLPAARDDFEARRATTAKVGLSGLKGLPVGHVAALALLAVVLVMGFFLSDSDDGPAGVAEIDSERVEQTLPSPISAPVVAPPAISVPTTPSSEAALSKDTLSEDTSSEPPTSESALLEMSSVVDEVPAPDATNGRSASDEQAQSSAPDQDQLKREPETDKTSPTVAPRADVLLDQPVVKPALPAPSNPDKNVISDAQKLLALEEDSYSLQIMSATSLDSLQQFRSEQANRAHLYIYKAQRQGRAWYILLAGNYPTRAMASDAISRLPQVQRAGGPWPRKLSEIQREIAEDQHH